MQFGKSSGFTLIEVMIAVAIVGILAGIAIPTYQSYVAKTQLNRVVGELGAYKAAVEERLATNSDLDDANLGYNPSNLTAVNEEDDLGVFNPDTSGHLEVTLGGEAHPHIRGTVIRWQRSSGGNWQCEVDASAANRWQNSYLPRGCEL